MCKSCGCNHLNYKHDMPKMPGSAKGIDKVNYNMPKVSVKKGKK